MQRKKTVVELYKKLKRNDECKPHLLFKYNSENKGWGFSGYRCGYCDRPVSLERIISHHEICKVLTT